MSASRALCSLRAVVLLGGGVPALMVFAGLCMVAAILLFPSLLACQPGSAWDCRSTIYETLAIAAAAALVGSAAAACVCACCAPWPAAPVLDHYGAV